MDHGILFDVIIAVQKESGLKNKKVTVSSILCVSYTVHGSHPLLSQILL